MAKGYLTHFSTIFLVHLLILLGTWNLAQSFKSPLNQLGPGVLKLQVASKVLMNTPVTPKKEVRALPKNPTKPKEKIQEKVVEAAKVPEVSAQGSVVGNSATGKADALSIYKAELRAMIDQNKYYPTMSKRLGQEGTVVVAFTLLPDGNIINIRIDRPSQYERLNSSALEAVKKVERFKPIPKEVGDDKMDIKVPVKFVTI